MGWVIERAMDGDVVRFMAMYRDLRGKQRSAGTFDTWDAATEAWGNAEEALHEGRLGDPKRGRQSFRTYVEKDWLPHHVIEASTREGYVYLLNRHILPEFGGRRMREILPLDVRAWVLDLQEKGVRPPTIRNCKVILDAILTTALNDQIVFMHAGRGVKTPPRAKKPKRIVTAEQFDRIHEALPEEVFQLLVEVDIESGARWGELTEFRPRDFDLGTGLLTISRAVVQLKAKSIPSDQRFVVKQYPKDAEWREVGLAEHIVAKVAAYIDKHGLGPDDLLFQLPEPSGPARRHRPDVLPDPLTLGRTEPNEKGRSYWHGTLTAYQAGKCRCDHCRNAIAAYRAERRAQGKDEPRPVRRVISDGHIPNDWFRVMVWKPALEKAQLGFHVTPHGLRHAHASWLLAGGADIQVVKERLGHGSITTTEGYLHTLPNAHETALAALKAIRGNIKEHTDSTTPRKKKPPKRKKQKSPQLRLDEQLAAMRDMVAAMSEQLIQMEQAG